MSYMVLERVEKVFDTLEDARQYAESNASTDIELVVAKKLGTVKIKTVFEADKKIKTATEKRVKKVVSKIETSEPVVLENESMVLFDNDYSIASNAPETIAYTDNFGFMENSEAEKIKTDVVNLGIDNFDTINENVSKKVFTSVLAKKSEVTPELKKDISKELNERVTKELKDDFYTQEEIIVKEVNELIGDKPIQPENITPVSDDNIDLVISQELPVNLSNDSLVLPIVVENDADIKEFVTEQISLLEENKKEVIETTEPVKVSEEKTFLCDIGPTSFPMLEKNVKKQCETKFDEAIHSSTPMERLKAEKETLINWYKKDQLINIDWFQNLYTAYLAKASKKELELATTNKPVKVATGEELFQSFENEVNQAQKEMAVYGVAKLEKYKELESLDKERLDYIINTKIHEIIVRDLVKNIATCSDSEQILKGYSKKTLNDQRVKDAIEARNKADIEKITKLNELKKEVEAIKEKHNPVETEKVLTGVELAIQEIKEATKETFAEITNKYKEYYLVNNEYYEAVKAKEKSFNVELFNELLEEIKDKSDSEVLRITSQVKYTYLANILKEEWNEKISPITTRVLVKELCNKLIETPVTKQKDILNKYSKEIQEHQEVLETIHNINTKF